MTSTRALGVFRLPSIFLRFLPNSTEQRAMQAVAAQQRRNETLTGVCTRVEGEVAFLDQQLKETMETQQALQAKYTVSRSFKIFVDEIFFDEKCVLACAFRCCFSCRILRIYCTTCKFTLAVIARDNGAQ